MPWADDRVRETASAPGSGNVTLLGAVTGFQSFATSTGSTSAIVSYAIADQNGGANWETGVGTFNGTATLTRDTVYRSSNGGAATNFSTGTQDVFCTLLGAHARQVGSHRAFLLVSGWALP